MQLRAAACLAVGFRAAVGRTLLLRDRLEARRDRQANAAAEPLPNTVSPPVLRPSV